MGKAGSSILGNDGLDSFLARGTSSSNNTNLIATNSSSAIMNKTAAAAGESYGATTSGRDRSGNPSGNSSSILINDGPLVPDISANNARYRTNSVTALSKEDAMNNFSSTLKQEDIENSYGLNSLSNAQKPANLSRKLV